MDLTLLDTFTGDKKLFIPDDPNNVTIYICGPTVYDEAHLGHARTYLTFDLMRKSLSMLGYDTTVVMNITDIDDKIINRAKEENISESVIAKRYEERFMDDMKSLGITPPDIMTRVTEHIDEIINFISVLIDKGYAYEKTGLTSVDVYFNLAKYLETNRYPGFNMADICEINEDGHFVLWKGNKEGIQWPSPWGLGRPGWHIECSAMATSIFGSHLDIHVGGVDLAFPHHANEIAQTQARYDNKWVKVFLHTGHLSIEGQKMSKSLKNFITIKSALTDFPPHVFRMYFAQHKYNSPMSFSYIELANAQKTWETFQALWRKISGLHAEEKWSQESGELLKYLQEIKAANIVALQDDLNLPKVILNLIELVSRTHSYIKDNKYPIAAQMVVKYTRDILHKLGFSIQEEPNTAKVTDLIQAFVDFRRDIRNSPGTKQSNYNLTDKLRKEIFPSLGIKVEDQGKESYWSQI